MCELFRAAELRAALDEGRLVLFGQPIRRLSGDQGPRHHYEVLLRLRAEDGGLIGPGRFVPAAERYGLMPAIDRWVVEQSIALASRADEPVSLSINLSGSTLGEPALIEVVERALRAAGKDVSVTFEITETAAIGNLQRALRFMEGLRELGCRFALDDFGTGLSSFGYIKDLPVDVLKVDGSFVEDMHTAPSRATMVRAINDLGHALGLETVAEWVSSEETLALLREFGVDFAQGFAVGRPAPLADQILGTSGD